MFPDGRILAATQDRLYVKRDQWRMHNLRCNELHVADDGGIWCAYQDLRIHAPSPDARLAFSCDGGETFLSAKLESPRWAPNAYSGAPLRSGFVCMDDEVRGPVVARVGPAGELQLTALQAPDWNALEPGSVFSEVPTTIAANGDYLCARTPHSGGIYCTWDSGANWKKCGEFPDSSELRGSEGMWWLSTDTGRLMVGTSDGSRWREVRDSGGAFGVANSPASDGTWVVVMEHDKPRFAARVNGSGTVSEKIPLDGVSMTAINAEAGRVALATMTGAFVLTGETWDRVAPPP
ncbi:MAG: hypothetical protein KC776_37290 [Myxococcales bacterium]|nr:hypothetical protein [Myxococcales bacterium]